MCPDIPERLKAVHAGHLQVQQDNYRHGAQVAALVFSSAKEVVKSLDAVACYDNFVEEVVFFEGTQRQFKIVLIIFNHHDYFFLHDALFSYRVK
jgi:hypothetical protein